MIPIFYRHKNGNFYAIFSFWILFFIYNMYKDQHVHANSLHAILLFNNKKTNHRLSMVGKNNINHYAAAENAFPPSGSSDRNDIFL